MPEGEVAAARGLSQSSALDTRSSSEKGLCFFASSIRMLNGLVQIPLALFRLHQRAFLLGPASLLLPEGCSCIECNPIERSGRLPLYDRFAAVQQFSCGFLNISAEPNHRRTRWLGPCESPCRRWSQDRIRQSLSRRCRSATAPRQELQQPCLHRGQRSLR